MLPNLLDQPDRLSPVSVPCSHQCMAEHPALSQHGMLLLEICCLNHQHHQAAEAPPGFYRGPAHRETIRSKGRASCLTLQAGFGLGEAAFAISLRCFYPRDPAGVAFPRMGVVISCAGGSQSLGG